MTFLCALEAVNLDNLFGDCQDLSTTRGGGLAVLRIAESVAKDLSARGVSMGSLQGLLLIEGLSASEVEQLGLRPPAKTLSLQNVLGYTQSCGFIVASMSVCPNGTGISWITFSAAKSSRFGSCSAPWLSPNCTRARQLRKWPTMPWLSPNCTRARQLRKWPTMSG